MNVSDIIKDIDIIKSASKDGDACLVNGTTDSFFIADPSNDSIFLTRGLEIVASIRVEWSAMTPNAIALDPSNTKLLVLSEFYDNVVRFDLSELDLATATDELDLVPDQCLDVAEWVSNPTEIKVNKNGNWLMVSDQITQVIFRFNEDWDLDRAEYASFSFCNIGK